MSAAGGVRSNWRRSSKQNTKLNAADDKHAGSFPMLGWAFVQFVESDQPPHCLEERSTLNDAPDAPLQSSAVFICQAAGCSS